jgi:uncharacterized protein HemX
VIIEIAIAVGLPSAAFAYQQWIQHKTRLAQESGAFNRSQLNVRAEKSRELNEQQNAALIANVEEIDRLKVRVKALEELIQEQQTSINRLADRY